MFKASDRVFDLELSSYPNTNKNKFKYSRQMRNNIHYIQSILQNSMGIYLISGLRGSGKTSVLNNAIENYKSNHKDSIFINIEYPHIQIDLYYEIIIHLEQYFRQSDLEHDECVKDILINLNKSRILYSSEIIKKASFIEKQMSLTESDEEDQVSISSQISFNQSFLPINIKLSLEELKHLLQTQKKSEEKIDKNEITINTITDKTEQQKKIIKLIRNISKNYKICIVIDELDKFSTLKMHELINNNKNILLESGILTFLVCDKANALKLKEMENAYLNDIIYINNLNINEGLVIMRNLEFSKSLTSLLKLYYLTLGNYRDMVKIDINEKANKSPLEDKDLSSKSTILYLLLHSEFYQSIPEEYKDIISSYFKILIDQIYILGSISKNEVAKFKNIYLDSHKYIDYTTELLIDRSNNLLFEEFTCCSEIWSIYGEVEYSYKTKISGKNKHIKKYLIKIHNAKYSFLKEKNNIIIKDTIYSEILNELSREFNMNHLKMKYDYNDMLKTSAENNKVQHEKYMEVYDIEKYFLRNIIKEFSKLMLYNHSNYVKCEFKLKSNFNSVDKAINFLELHKNELIGIIFLYPYIKTYEDRVLNNCFIVLENEENVLIYSFLGYPGLTSHKPNQINYLKGYLKDNNVAYVEINGNDYLKHQWDNFIGDNNSLPEFILETSKDIVEDKVLELKRLYNNYHI